MSQVVALTLSETQALCAKAARGAGYPWALADEAGRAAAWLAAQGLPGAALILAWATGPRLAAPEPEQAWAGEGALCPIRTGIALADHARLPEGPGGDKLRLARVAYPGLLLPFLATASRLAGTGFALQANGNTLHVGAGGGRWLCDLAEGDVLIVPSAVPPDPKPTALPLVPVAVCQALEQLALGATVPPSATSRSGAGAAGSDND